MSGLASVPKASVTQCSLSSAFISHFSAGGHIRALPKNMRFKPGELNLARHKYESQSLPNLQMLRLLISRFQANLLSCQDMSTL